MLQVKLTTTSADWPLQRQTPGESGVWGNCQFLINQEVESCDCWVVYDDLPECQETTCPPQNTILITAEPPSVKSYARNFTRQFGTIVTCNRQIRAPRVIYSQSSLPWHVGRRSRAHQNISFSKNYDELAAMQSFEKKRLISVITSDKKFTRGHRQRLELVNRLKQHFGAQLDVFGRGINEIEDKWDAIAGYRYHIALENCSYPDYWTEKLSDAYLAGALPIYFGCPNVKEYFPERSVIPISSDFSQAAAVIEKTLKEDPYQDLVPEIMQARRLVLDTYNLFPRLHALINQVAAAGEGKRQVTLKPASEYTSALDRIRVKINGYIHRLL